MYINESAAIGHFLCHWTAAVSCSIQVKFFTLSRQCSYNTSEWLLINRS